MSGGQTTTRVASFNRMGLSERAGAERGYDIGLIARDVGRLDDAAVALRRGGWQAFADRGRRGGFCGLDPWS